MLLRTLAVIVLVLATSYWRPASAHYNVEMAPLGCGGIYEDYVFNWYGHSPNPYVTVEKASLNTGPWELVTEVFSFTMCYGPTAHRRWYRATWCDDEFAVPCGPQDMAWSPLEPCG